MSSRHYYNRPISFRSSRMLTQSISTLVLCCLLCPVEFATSFLIPKTETNSEIRTQTQPLIYNTIVPLTSKGHYYLTTERYSNNVSPRTSNIHRMSKDGSSNEGTTISTTSKIISTQDELDDYAKGVGVKITFSTLGPGYRAVARAYHDPEQILGYCEGFVRPAGKILHVDKLEIWKKAIDRAKAENPTSFTNGGQVFGVALLLGYTCMLHAKSKNCTIAEFLAIDDEDFQHKRLVRFFKRAGFQVVRYVGEDIGDVPDRLVWGGCGTLMNRDIDALLVRWSKILKV